MGVSNNDLCAEIKSQARDLEATKVDLHSRMDWLEANLEARCIAMQSQLEKAMTSLLEKFMAVV